MISVLKRPSTSLPPHGIFPCINKEGLSESVTLLAEILYRLWKICLIVRKNTVKFVAVAFQVGERWQFGYHRDSVVLFGLPYYE